MLKSLLKAAKLKDIFCWVFLVEELVRESVTFKTWLDVLVRGFFFLQVFT